VLSRLSVPFRHDPLLSPGVTLFAIRMNRLVQEYPYPRIIPFPIQGTG